MYVFGDCLGLCIGGVVFFFMVGVGLSSIVVIAWVVCEVVKG